MYEKCEMFAAIKKQKRNDKQKVKANYIKMC